MRKLADGIWEFTAPLRLMGLLELGHRMTVMELAGGKLLVHSPVALTPAVRAELESLGQPEIFVAPNTMHDLYWADWVAAYPEAKFYAPEGMKLPGSFHALPASGDFAEGVTVQDLNGMPGLREHVFMHEPSQSLIVADLVFNLGQGADFTSGLMLKLLGIHGQMAPSKLFRSLIQDRAAFAGSVEQMLSLPFGRLIVSHGAIVESGAKPASRAGLNDVLLG